ncbi:unnamed protein product [Caenorhabditis auriculariae]|uniref:Transmembrane protein 26 n=1 Tax=Caenorhabditis auriculariae TaxID=2777116 RepID=A0A8S1H8X0_9PELO|nr:unnamed protein product [Caenorhabditis auriculariae]
MDYDVTPTRRSSTHHHRHSIQQPKKTPVRRPQSVDASQVLISCSRAILVRALFIVHSLVTIRHTVRIEERDSVWAFATLSLLIVFEGGYAIIMRAGDERKWFCTSVLLYIVATAPPIWILETKICRWRHQTVTTAVSDISIDGASDELRLQLMEQLLLVNLIVGRWLLPKGDISREQLSQILLAYLAISSDIVEFFDVFKEKAVFSNTFVQRIVLAAWTSIHRDLKGDGGGEKCGTRSGRLSLLQFPFVLTVSRARKMRVAITNDYEQFLTPRRPTSIFKAVYDVDIWAIVLANMLQDIPFLLVRLYLMAYHSLVTYTMIFFFFKNMLIILLQTYRAIIILNDRYINPKPPGVEIDMMEQFEHEKETRRKKERNAQKKKKPHSSNNNNGNKKKKKKPTSRRSSRARSLSDEREHLFPSPYHRHSRSRIQHMDTLEECIT